MSPNSPAGPGTASAAAAASRPRARTTTLQVGRFRLTGWRASVALLAIIAAIAALIVRAHPSRASWPMFVSGALWLVFVAYWGAAAQHAARPERTESRASRRFHERLLNSGLLVLLLPIPGLRGRFLPAAVIVAVAGIAIQVLAGMLAVWARRHLGRNWSGAISVVEGHRLVRSGPYRLLRHPIYTAMLGMSAGTALASGEWHAIVGMALVVAAYWRKIRLEERHLGQLFGEAYDDYRRASWALIPGLF